MEIVITGTAADSGADDLRSLRGWLAEESELKGSVQLVASELGAGKLGGLTDALIVAVGPGAGLTALASVTIAWLRSRAGSVSYKLTRKDGNSIEVSAERVRKLDSDAVKALIAQVGEVLQEADGDNARSE